MTAGREIRKLWKEINALKKASAFSMMDGRVADVKDNMVRLELEPSGDGGKPFLSSWVRVQEEAGDRHGGYSSYTQKQVGQPMRLLSPNGEIGPASLAIDSGHVDDDPNPGSGKAKVMKHGDATIVVTTDKIEIAVGASRLVITAGEIVTHGKTRLDNGDRKIHRVADLDSDGDRAVGGAARVFA